MKIVSALIVSATLAAASPTLAGTMKKNIVDTAAGAGTFNTLIAAAKAAGLAGALAEGKDLTVFAPTDEAFAALPAGTVEKLLKPENKDQLAAILSYHVLPAKVASTDLEMASVDVKTLKEAGDTMVTVKKDSMGVTVDGAKVIQPDILASNGIIHVIDKVILPSS